MKDLVNLLESLRQDADAIDTVLSAAQRIAESVQDEGLSRLLSHARSLAEGLSNDIDVKAEKLAA